MRERESAFRSRHFKPASRRINRNPFAKRFLRESVIFVLSSTAESKELEERVVSSASLITSARKDSRGGLFEISLRDENTRKDLQDGSPYTFVIFLIARHLSLSRKISPTVEIVRH